MISTVQKGTARGVISGLKRKLRRKLTIGAKTGSITGGFPHGKHEWITVFAKPRGDKTDKGISISVLNINHKKWYIRSSHIAKKLIEFYFSSLRDEQWNKITKR